MDTEDIASLCASLSISHQDGPVQILDEHLMVNAKIRMSLCLVGKVLTNKRVNREAFMRVIGKIWRVKEGVEIKSVTGNTFSFHFRNRQDLDRVVEEGPWSFDNVLIAMELPIGKGTIDSLIFNQA